MSVGLNDRGVELILTEFMLVLPLHRAWTTTSPIPVDLGAFPVSLAESTSRINEAECVGHCMDNLWSLVTCDRVQAHRQTVPSHKTTTEHTYTGRIVRTLMGGIMLTNSSQ